MNSDRSLLFIDLVILVVIWLDEMMIDNLRLQILPEKETDIDDDISQYPCQ